MNFSEYLQQQKVEPGLGEVLTIIADGLPQVAEAMRGGLEGQAGSENVYGEKQLKLDLYANDLFTEALKKSAVVSMVASEELDNSEDGTAGDGGYSVAYDPLDGSSLVDVNLAVGSIFGVYKGKGFVGRSGGEQVAALIAVYGPRLTFMVSVGHGVTEFIYNWSKKEFIVNHENVKVDEEKKMFAPGNLRACGSEDWYVLLLEYWVDSNYTLRYSGGMVPDVNQILKKGGGVFTYPGYKEMPEGKLRLLYECAPMAYLVEQAGGMAISNNGRILDLKLEKLDQRTPIYLGSKKEVEKVRSYLKK